MEAAFTFLFFARVKFKIEYVFEDILPWKREDVTWQPGCSHSALMERPRGLFDMTDEQVTAYNAERQKREDVLWQPACSYSALMERPRGLVDMTDEQVTAYNAERQKRAKEQVTAYNAERQKRAKEQAAANSNRWIAKERAQDLKGYQAKRLKSRLAWQGKKKTRTRSLRRQLVSAPAPWPLDDTNAKFATKAHLEQVRLAEGGAPKVVSVETTRCRKFSAKHKAAKTYYCPVCDRAFNTKAHLNKHNASKKHLAKIAAAAAKAAAANAKRRKHVKEQHAIKGKRWEAEQRTTDLKGYLAKKLRQKLAWEAKNKDKVLATAVGVCARAVAP
ncbi:Putative Zinc finger C2H2-type [Colletotrichum destructivum]|uniref:Zinc finger C2H2-type n=1 Tax=Colletotrichum destructivum TaxID=34406 RepID=A0AAX4IMK2_9PEZI|nr:Putative Zinc finger C2H2-type [Colletotrichum destructivum]